MGFLSKGKEKETQFSNLFKNVSTSDKESDINEHWDLKVEYKFDVKGLKKIKRDDVYCNEFYHFIELKNVRGKLGWLYGEADFFAFETNEYWVIVSKEALQEFIKKKVQKVKVTNVDECLYCLYSREGRKDVMTLVKTIDLMVIATEVVPKGENVVEHIAGDSIYPEKNIKKKMEQIFKK